MFGSAKKNGVWMDQVILTKPEGGLP